MVEELLCLDIQSTSCDPVLDPSDLLTHIPIRSQDGAKEKVVWGKKYEPIAEEATTRER